MKKLMFVSVFVLCFGVVLPLLAVTVSEDNDYVIITTAGYEAHWRKDSQTGYMQAFLSGSQDSLIGTNGRAFYHSSNYAGGWNDWGAMSSYDVLEEGAGKAVIKYESQDAGTKIYTSVVSYYDNAPYIKHELTITSTGDPTESFVSNHEPMFEPNMDMDGMATFDTPFPHACWWVHGGFVALYGPSAQEAPLSARDGRDPGRMGLNHDHLATMIGNGESASVTYYVAFGSGGENEAHALADHVQEEPSTSAVSPAGSLTTRWGWIRAR